MNITVQEIGFGLVEIKKKVAFKIDIMLYASTKGIRAKRD